MTPSTNTESPFTFEPNIFPRATTASSSDDALPVFGADPGDDQAGPGLPTCGTSTTPTCPLQ